MAGNKKVKGEMRSSRASLGESSFADAESPEFTYHTLLNGVYSYYFFNFFFPYASQPTLVPLPSLPTSPPVRQNLKDREPHQSAGFSEKLPPPLTLPEGPAPRCCVSPASIPQCLRAGSRPGAPAERGDGNPERTRNGV